jgi:hypothetical protein
VNRYVVLVALAAAAMVAQSGREAKPPASTGATGEPQPQATAATATEIPPLPACVTELKFSDFFLPIGRRGLELTDRLKSLDRKRVRILGYMARQCDAPPGLLLLTPVPVTLHTHEYGLADDLPPASLHVHLTGPDRDRAVPYTPGLLLLTGTLSVGPQEEADGRVSAARLVLDPPGSDAQSMVQTTGASPPPPAPRRQGCCSNEETTITGRARREK